MPEIVFDSEWLKARVNVHQGDHIKFLDTGTKIKDRKGRDQWVFVVGVIPKGRDVITVQKKFSLNKSNFTAITEIYGSNSDKWVGKEMRVSIIQTNNPSGQLVPAIRLTGPGLIDQGLIDEPESELGDEGDFIPDEP